MPTAIADDAALGDRRVEARATCRTWPAARRCSGTRRRSSRRPRRTPRRCHRARASRPSPSADRLDHRHRRHGQTPSSRRCRTQVRRHVLVDVLEHRRGRSRSARWTACRGVSASFCAARTSSSSACCTAGAARRPTRRRVRIKMAGLSRSTGSPSGQWLALVGRAVLGRVVGGRVRPGAVGDPLDQRRAEVAPCPLGRPLRHRVARRGNRCRRRAATAMP